MLVLPGGIRLKNEAFDTIHESDGPSSGGSEVDETAEHVMDPGRLDVVLNPAHDPTYFHVEYHFGKDESRLQVLMRTLVVSMSTPPFSRAVTYHQTLESLLFATVHLDGEDADTFISSDAQIGSTRNRPYHAGS
ncbi:MAG: hypothetical protein M1838_004056 [Thelocarpon superellum]|nr:MAG: hypothetical protein M1838_004056 [Thelocarpon superellum]